MRPSEPGPSAAGNLRITKPCLLLVEGRDECRFFRALTRRLDRCPGEEIQILEVGEESARSWVPRIARVLPRTEVEVRAVGLVRDADESPEDAWRSVRNLFERADWTRPEEPGRFTAARPRTGALILPDADSRGSLETLCRRAVRNGPAGRCVGELLDCLDRRNGWEPRGQMLTARRDKGFAHAWLASRKNPVARVGEGADQDAWPLDHEVFGPIREFLCELVRKAA